VSNSELLITSGRNSAQLCSYKKPTINALGDKFKPELCSAWLAYIRKTYPYGLVEATDHDIMGDSTLKIDGRVPDALGLYAH
jgi:hypothetical protein